MSRAEILFQGTGIQITCIGKSYIPWSPLGTRSLKEDFVRVKVGMWSNEIDRLSLFVKTEPHAAFVALTHGLMSRWTYLLRCIDGISPLLQLLEQTIQLAYPYSNRAT